MHRSVNALRKYFRRRTPYESTPYESTKVLCTKVRKYFRTKVLSKVSIIYEGRYESTKVRKYKVLPKVLSKVLSYRTTSQKVSELRDTSVAAEISTNCLNICNRGVPGRKRYASLPSPTFLFSWRS